MGPNCEDVVRFVLERSSTLCARYCRLHVCALRSGRNGNRGPDSVDALVSEVRGGRQNRFGGLPFHEAIMSGHLTAIRALLKQGARTDIEDADGTTSLSMASKVPAIPENICCQGSQNARARMMHCADCGAPSNNKCNGCCLVVYCSTECQKVPWRTHKTECKAAQSKASDMGCIEVRLTLRAVPCSITCNKTGKNKMNISAGMSRHQRRWTRMVALLSRCRRMVWSR